MKHRITLKARTPNRMYLSARVKRIQIFLKQQCTDHRLIFCGGRQVGKSTLNELHIEATIELHKELRRLIGKRAYLAQFPISKAPHNFPTPVIVHDLAVKDLSWLTPARGDYRRSFIDSMFLFNSSKHRDEHFKLTFLKQRTRSTDQLIFSDMEMPFSIPDWLQPIKKDTVCPLLQKS